MPVADAAPPYCDEIIDLFRQQWPKNFESIVPIITQLQSDKPIPYSLLLGAVQSGKFLTINILSWILMIKHGFNVCYLTKKLDIVRNDVLDKLIKGLINQTVKKYCTQKGVDATPYLLTAESGLETRKPTTNTVPIFLMEHVNYVSVFRYLLNSAKKTLVIVDEVHELYTDTKFDLLDGGLEPTDVISNRHFLHKICEIARTNNNVSILGVTATPERVLIKDPVCWVEKIYHLNTDAPVEGFRYYGYKGDHLENISVKERDDNYVDTVHNILLTPTNVMPNGQHEIKVIYISTATYAADQAEIYEQLTGHFGDQIFCKMLIADDTRRDNDLPPEYNVTSLDEFFSSSNITEKICTNGAMVLIARKTLAASTTVKPMIGNSCELTVNGGIYKVFGITDQITGRASSIEDHFQKSRLFGWYPAGHSSTYWVPANYVDDMTDGVILTHLEIINKYNPSIGPASLEYITSSMQKVPKICAGKCPYSLDHIEEGRRILNHTNLPLYTSWSPNDLHRQTMKQLGNTSTVSKVRFYDLFGKVCLKRLITLRGDMYHSTWHSMMYKQLDETTIKAGRLIASSAVSLTDKISKTEKIMSRFIAEQLNVKDTEKIKIKTKKIKTNLKNKGVMKDAGKDKTIKIKGVMKKNKIKGAIKPGRTRIEAT